MKKIDQKEKGEIGQKEEKEEENEKAMFSFLRIIFSWIILVTWPFSRERASTAAKELHRRAST